jgi:hypothetical protein
LLGTASAVKEILMNDRSSETSSTAPGPLPRRVRVLEVIESRYQPGKRPVSWDDRRAGRERVRTADGEVLVLASNGGQSSPAPGWELLLTRQVDADDPMEFPAVEWTLYGLS